MRLGHLEASSKTTQTFLSWSFHFLFFALFQSIYFFHLYVSYLFIYLVAQRSIKHFNLSPLISTYSPVFLHYPFINFIVYLYINHPFLYLSINPTLEDISCDKVARQLEVAEVGGEPCGYQLQQHV